MSAHRNTAVLDATTLSPRIEDANQRLTYHHYWYPLHDDAPARKLEIAQGQYTLQDTSPYEGAFLAFYEANTSSEHTGLPIVLLISGVPTYSAEWISLMHRVAPFVRVVAVDPLGMGNSDMPPDAYDWDRPWEQDADMLAEFMYEHFGGHKYFVLGSDWGGGSAQWIMAKYPERLLGGSVLNPIAMDGYPIPEIEDIGKLAPILKKHGAQSPQFQTAVGGFGQTVTQIMKTMSDSRKWSNYGTRLMLKPYRLTNYEDLEADALSMTYRWQAIGSLVNRASVLAPRYLQQYDVERNPVGLKFQDIDIPVLIMWGLNDNMMPPAQMFRMKKLMVNARVTTAGIPDAGHFAELDNPDEVATRFLEFVANTVGGERHMGRLFFGLGVLAKGDERELEQRLRDTHEHKYRSVYSTKNRRRRA